MKSSVMPVLPAQRITRKGQKSQNLSLKLRQNNNLNIQSLRLKRKKKMNQIEALKEKSEIILLPKKHSTRKFKILHQFLLSNRQENAKCPNLSWRRRSRNLRPLHHHATFLINSNLAYKWITKVKKQKLSPRNPRNRVYSKMCFEILSSRNPMLVKFSLMLLKSNKSLWRLLQFSNVQMDVPYWSATFLSGMHSVEKW